MFLTLAGDGFILNGDNKALSDILKRDPKMTEVPHPAIEASSYPPALLSVAIDRS